MPLREIKLDLPTDPELPPAVAELLAEVDQRSDVFYDSGKNKTIPSIVPSDPVLQYLAIKAVTDQGYVTGRLFCEWGSGFGTATLLASLLGYESYGLEIEPSLAEFSRDLASDLEIEAEFLESSYLPEGLDTVAGFGGADLVSESDDLLTFGVDSGDGETLFCYEGMDIPTADFDLFFVYPWPADWEMMLDLFEAVASEDAVLITYYGDGEMCAHIKE